MISVVAVLLLAGCLVGPFGGQQGPVQIVVENAHNVTYTFEAWVVEYPSNVTIQRSDGNVATGKLSPGLATHEPGPHHFTSVEFSEPARLHGRYALAPGDEKKTKIEDFSPDLIVVVIIYQSEDTIVSYVSAHCDGDLVFLDVTMLYYGSRSAYNCEGGFG